MLEKITTSLEVSKKLYELGVDGLAGIYHVCFHPRSFFEDFTEGLVLRDYVNHISVIPNSDIPARTSEELGYALPNQVLNHKWINIGRYDDGWVVRYESMGTLAELRIEDKKLVDAIARMLILLIEDEYILVEKINKKLREFWVDRKL